MTVTEARSRTHADLDATRRREVDLLSNVLGQVLREAGLDDVAGQLDLLRADPAAAGAIADVVDLADAEHIARALTVHLHLVNLADERHRARLLQHPLHSGDADAGDALWPAVSAAGDQVLSRLDQLRINPVLTAHPTEARRRAVATALRRIAEQLTRHGDPQVGDDERFVARRRLLEEVDLLYRTSVLRATRPGPLDEVETIMTVFDQTLFRAVPRLYRATEATLIGDASGSVPTPVPAFVRFGSWVGGDRDGNPYVTAEVTRQAVATHAEHALRWLRAAVLRVGRTMTLDAGDTPASRELMESLAADSVAGPVAFDEVSVRSPHEPHRQKMLIIAERVRATRDGELEASYRSPDDLLDDLRLVQRSLHQAGARRAAHGELQHLIWSVETFGFHLAELEIRQHSRVHRAALLDLVGQLPGVIDPAAHVDDPHFLDDLAVDGWPAFVQPREETTKEVLDTFRVMAGCSSGGAAVLRALRRVVHAGAGAPGGRARPGPAGRGRLPDPAGRRPPPGDRSRPEDRGPDPGRLAHPAQHAAVAGGPGPLGRGHARVLGLRQGRRPRQREPEPRPHPGRPRHLGGPSRRAAHPVPRPRRLPGPGGRPTAPGDRRPATRVGRGPVEGHRTR